MEEKFSHCPNILKRLTEKRIGNKIAAAPKVSVIIPAYNVAPYIKETLDSVFAQTFTNFEVVLVNDGSKDTEELEILLAPYFEKIIYGKQKNLGASQARNAAICLARGELLAFLDGDDVWLPEYLEAQINALSAKDCDLIYADALLFGDFRLKSQTFMTKAPSVGAVTAESLIGAKCNVITSGTVVRREKVLQAELFDETLPPIGMEDFDLWFRLVKNGARLDYQRKVLLKYRIRPNSLSGNNVERAERSIHVLNIICTKFELAEKEKAVWEERMNIYQAQLELEKGKFCLVQGDFSNAQIHISQANKFFRKPKLSLINWLMRFSPKLTLQLFRKIHPSEVAFILPNKS